MGRAEVPEPCAGGPDHAAERCRLVAAEIGHDDEVAGIEDGNELLFDIPELAAELVRPPVSLIARPEA